MLRRFMRSFAANPIIKRRNVDGECHKCAHELAPGGHADSIALIAQEAMHRALTASALRQRN